MEAKTSEWRPGPTVCRCCLTEGCYKDISTEYFWMGKREVYAEMLADTLNLTIAYSQSGGPNSNSRLICEPCISRLRDAADFKRQVQECEKTFLQHLDPSTSGIVAEDVSRESILKGKQVKIELVKLEKDSDDDDFEPSRFTDDDDVDDDIDDQPLTKLAKTPKKETVDLLDLIDNAKVAEKRKSTTKVKATPVKKAKQKKDTKATANQDKPEKKKKGAKDSNVKWKTGRKLNDVRDNAAIIIECSNVCPFRWRWGQFICAYCPTSFGDFKGFREHVAKHSKTEEAPRLSRPVNTTKAEVSDLQCELCSQKAKDLDELVEHLISVHNKPIVKQYGVGITPFYLNGDEYICTQCGVHFDLFTKLNSHMNNHSTDHICYKCGKTFSGAIRLKSHLVTHELTGEGCKCTKCGETFANLKLRATHMSTVHKPKLRYRCTYCNEKFKEYNERAKHLQKVHDKKREHACHLCQSVFSTYNQRTRHIQFVHLKVKPFQCPVCPYRSSTKALMTNHAVKHDGTRKFQCDVCSKSYARLKSLREHMRIHINDRRFTCEYCSSAFVQKCSLKSHIRTHHPKAVSETKDL
ncbi:PREDICTED: zinc finger protein 568 isoform X8 [Papilio xuthus]|uniref:Zinc finger protein 568 isoform X8 n=1 Tax=Papilio xuthus TaxID=66420 RepID=A0AAJ6Z2C4_PAPXU|nr:PREDICTED: zinc finger protein 568 isoform X8 [Papilio xuthus]